MTVSAAARSLSATGEMVALCDPDAAYRALALHIHEVLSAQRWRHLPLAVATAVVRRDFHRLRGDEMRGLGAVHQNTSIRVSPSMSQGAQLPKSWHTEHAAAGPRGP